MRLYVNDVKRDIKDFKDVKMFGTVLNICGYDLAVRNHQFENACCVEYHVDMFNKYRNHKWTIERFMEEVGIKPIGEGVTLNQLIPIYIKYKIGFHAVDFKYHLTTSHHDHGYKPTQHIPHLFYMIEGGHLYSITNKQHQRSLAQISDKPQKTFKPKKENPVKQNVNVFHRPGEI